jgi:two-component system chemotaxis response regulator CheY
MKLLIVDDSLIIRRQIEREIKISGINEIYQANNGLEAVKMCKQYKPDIVTMDLTMPEMDGVVCVKELMAINPKIMILVISALSDKATAIQAIKNGARGFICKPFTEEDLNKALSKLLSDAGKKLVS